jgi:hypothetical protein
MAGLGLAGPPGDDSWEPGAAHSTVRRNRQNSYVVL